MKSRTKKINRLRRFNNLLTEVVIIVALYLVVWPFLPKFDFWWKSVRHSNPPLVTAIIKSKPGDVQAPKDNTLVIPALHLQQTIYDGYPYTALSKGVWHSSHGSSPDKGSNTVIAGHRFTYHGFQRGASTFYNLDQLKAGDQIVIYWHKIRYDYQVSRNFVVQPTNLSVEDATAKPQLTLYTCTPLWTSTNRLIITAELVSEEAS